jgi:hypothetical protein
MSAALVFLVLFAGGWLAVAGSTVVRFVRARWMRPGGLLARAGLLVWFTGIIAAMFAEVRHWPASQVAPRSPRRRAGTGVARSGAWPVPEMGGLPGPPAFPGRR